MVERTGRTTEFELTEVDGAVGVIFPEAFLERLGLREGDTLSVVETPDGLRLSVGDLRHEAGMVRAHLLMEKRRAVLRELKD